MSHNWLREQRWFQDWLQGLVARVAPQQDFFSAIYEPVVVPGARTSESLSSYKSTSNETEDEPASDILQFCAVIGNNSKNQNGTDKSTNNHFKSEEEIIYSEGESSSIYAWGYFNYESYFKPELRKGLPGVAIVQVACGVDHTVFLTDLGKVYCSGQNTHYQLGDGTMMDHDNPTQVTKIDHLNITKISCGSSFTVALTDTGNVVMWGTLRHGDKFGTLVLQEPAFVKPLRQISVIDIACGGAHILALGSDGALYTWGNPTFGRLGRHTEANHENDPRLPRPVTSLQGIQISQISCGEQHSILLTSDAKMYCWGRNDHRECYTDKKPEILLPELVDYVHWMSSKVDQVRAGFRLSMCRSGNRIFAWGAGFKPYFIDPAALYLSEGTYHFPVAYQLGMATDDFKIVDMVTGSQHCILLSDSGRVFSFGLSANGQTGLDTPEYSQDIREVLMDKRIDSIAAGGRTSVAINVSTRSLLGESMQKLIDSLKLFGDVLLKPSDGQPIYAHKAILAVRSPVLKSKILAAEKLSNGSMPVLDFTQYNSKQLYAILVYIYTYRLLSSSLTSAELTEFVKSFSVKDPVEVKQAPQSILANDLRKLLVWQTNEISTRNAPLLKKNKHPLAGHWADIKFMVQGREIMAHKAILCANSEYFRLMLTGGMKESQMSVLEVQDDITFEAFVATLQFLYTDNVDVDVNYALDILPVASLYNLQRLKQKCEGIIEKQVEIDSVAYVWQVARYSAAQRLESFCLDLLLPMFEAVQKTKAFKNLTKEEQDVLQQLFEAK